MAKVVLFKEADYVIVAIPVLQTAENLSESIPGSRVIDDSALPSREWRDAWTVDGGIDLEKAKKIYQQKIRNARNEKLQKLDIEWMKAMERGEIKIAASIAANKQILRDLPEREEITNAESLEALKSFWPAVLEV